ncbi:MAG: hypothetical protein ACOC2A_03500 [Halanaeroarchaeum sp.]
MQRRAAAAYFVLFMVIGAGAYAYIGMAERPEVDLDGGEMYTEGDELTVGDRTYSVDSAGGGSGEVSWTRQDAQYTASLANNSTVSWQDARWDGQEIESQSIANGSTVEYDDEDYLLLTNTSADPPTISLERESNRSEAETVELGETLTVTVEDRVIRDANLSEISDEAATLTWGSEYRVAIPNETDPTAADMIERQDIERILELDPDVENSLGTSPDGSEYVQYRNGTQVSPDEYLPEPAVDTIEEGDTVQYEGNETTVGNITREEVPLTWRDNRTTTVEFAEGEVTEVNNESYLAHFPDDSTMQLLENTTENRQAYQAEQDQIDKYSERKAGLWGVVILSLFAAIILLMAAYLPVKD